MFSFHWHLPYLAVAILAAGAFDFYCSRLLHARYGKQFGAGFVGAGLVSFSLPALLIIGVPVYLILASGLELSDRLMMLGAILLCCLWSGWPSRRASMGAAAIPSHTLHAHLLRPRYLAASPL